MFSLDLCDCSFASDFLDGLDVYFHHERETKNYLIKNRVATRPMCAVAYEMLFEARAWNVDGKVIS